MTALAANAFPKTAVRGRGSYIVTNAATVYPGGGVGLTTAGRLSPWSDTAGLSWRGRCVGGTTRNSSANAGGKVVGDTSASPPYEADVIETGERLLGVPVAGASAQTDADGTLVFCATDNLLTDLSLTATVNVGPIGRIRRFNSATSFDVELFTPNEYALNNGKYQTWSIPVQLAGLTNANFVTGFVPGFAGRILSMQFVNTVVVTTAAKAALLNAEIDAVDVTGGVVALTSANQTPLGARVAGSAITAANHFAATSAIDFEAASVTAFAEGAGLLLVLVVAD